MLAVGSSKTFFFRFMLSHMWFCVLIYNRWTRLQSLKLSREKSLRILQRSVWVTIDYISTNCLCSVQDFWRTCDETKAWINEKDIAFSSEDCGKDLASVQLLQRKQQVISGVNKCCLNTVLYSKICINSNNFLSII